MKRILKDEYGAYMPVLLAVVLLLASGTAGAVEIEAKTVEVVGTGSGIKDAIADGLIEAIGQVAGRFLESESELKTMEVSAIDGADEAYFSSQSFQDKIKSATKGAVKEYEILEQAKNDQGLWDVRLSVTCLKVIPDIASRKKVVCATFSFPGEPKDGIFSLGDLSSAVIKGTAFAITQEGNPGEIAASLIKPGAFDAQAIGAALTGEDKPARMLARAFTDHLEAYLVQSRKFMVLDRRKTDALASEKQIALDGNVPIEAFLKITTDNVSDLVVVGGVEMVDYVIRKVTMKSGREIEVGEGFVEIGFRIIALNLKQVKYSDRVRFVYTDDVLRELSGSFTIHQAGNLMMADAAEKIGRQIVNAIYPLRVIGVTGKVVTLNEGGRGIKDGQIYDIYALGDEKFDPYTKESLGREEITVGKMKITNSGDSKKSSGIIIEQTGDILEGAIVRLAKANEEMSIEKSPPPGKKLNTDDLF